MISQEFEALEPRDIPLTYLKNLPLIEPWQLAARIKKFKKPKSMVKGNIFPALMTLYCDRLALPLSDVYNEITVTYVWPSIWKRESVTVIPKVGHPSSFGTYPARCWPARSMKAMSLDGLGRKLA